MDARNGCANVAAGMRRLCMDTISAQAQPGAADACAAKIRPGTGERNRSMVELITEMVRKESGLYDLTIKMKDGRVLIDVRGIRQKRAIGLIAETEQKVDKA